MIEIPNQWPEAWVQQSMLGRLPSAHDRIVCTLERMRAALVIQQHRPAAILDLACGDGCVVRDAMQLVGSDAEHIGVDIEDHWAFEKSNFSVRDMHAMWSRKFDLVLCLHAAYRSNDLDQLFRAIASALHPTSLALIDFWTDGVFRAHPLYDAPGFGELLYGWLRCAARESFPYPGSFVQESDAVLTAACAAELECVQIVPFLHPELACLAYSDYRVPPTRLLPPASELVKLIAADPAESFVNGGGYFSAVLKRAR